MSFRFKQEVPRHQYRYCEVLILVVMKETTSINNVRSAFMYIKQINHEFGGLIQKPVVTDVKNSKKRNFYIHQRRVD